MGLIARIMLLIGGSVAGWFVAPDANNFQVVSFIAALLIFSACVALAAFGPALIASLRAARNSRKTGA